MDSIVLSFVGDISLNGIYDGILTSKGPNFPFKQVKSIFDESDVVIGNLESPLVPEGIDPQFKMKTPLRADPKYAEGLKWAGFDILCLSNNHILDYGETGVDTTQEALAKQKIRYFGYGKNVYSAKKLKIISVHSIKIGFVGYTDVIIDSPFFASGIKSGIAKFDIDSVIKDIHRYKKLVDLLVINLHWGIEYFHLPSPEQIENARRLIDAGADIIIGHHPHTLQGIERYGDGIIAYSLGNFVFADIEWDWFTCDGEKRTTHYQFSRNCRKSVILTVAVNKQKKIDYKVTGTFISKTGLLKANVKSAIRRLTHLSTLLTISDYSTFFQKELKRFERKMLITRTFSRFKRIYKLRPKHFRELKHILCSSNPSE